MLIRTENELIDVRRLFFENEVKVDRDFSSSEFSNILSYWCGKAYAEALDGRIVSLHEYSITDKEFNEWLEIAAKMHSKTGVIDTRKMDDTELFVYCTLAHNRFTFHVRYYDFGIDEWEADLIARYKKENVIRLHGYYQNDEDIDRDYDLLTVLPLDKSIEMAERVARKIRENTNMKDLQKAYSGYSFYKPFSKDYVVKAATAYRFSRKRFE